MFNTDKDKKQILKMSHIVSNQVYSKCTCVIRTRIQRRMAGKNSSVLEWAASVMHN